MRDDNPIGTIVKGGHSAWSFDMQGFPVFWINKADELHRMVELGFLAWREDIEALRVFAQSQGLSEFHQKPSTLIVSFFLASLAIENLLKAILVREHPDYIKDGRFHGPVISSHNLKDIADDAGIELTDDEKDFCELGTECIQSFGRYHIAKNMTHSPTQLSVKEAAFSVYENFFERLKSDIHQKPFADRTEQ